MLRLFFSISIFFLSIGNIFASVFLLDNKLTSKNLGEYIEYFEDTGKNLSIDDIVIKTKKGELKWQKSDSRALSFGFSDSIYWVKLSVQNNTGEDINWLLEQVYPLINFIDFYYFDKDDNIRSIKTGNYFDFSKRPVENRTVVFLVKSFAKKSGTYFMRFESESSMNIDIMAYSEEGFQEMKDNEAPFLWIFNGILIVMIIYNLFIFFSVKDLSYFYYILLILSFLFLSMALNGTAFQYLWPNSPWWANQCIPFLIGILAFNFVQFGRYFTEAKEYFHRMEKVNFVMLGIILLSSFATLFINNYRFSILLVTGLAAIILTYNTPVLLISAFVMKLRQSQFFTGSISFLLIGLALYILKTYGILTENFLTSYSMQIGVVAMVVLLSLGLADRINSMRKEIQKAEKKYRNLIESSNDIIFSLDQDLKFLSVNKAMRKHLGFKEEDVLGKNFLEFIQETWSEKNNIARRIVEEYISDLKRSRESVSFRTDFKSRFSHEPKELTVKLEFTETEGKEEILGKASLVTDDIVIQFLESEKHIYTADNYLSNAELLSHRLTRNLVKYMKASDVPEIRVAIREMLVNAIEHGNLALEYSEKTKAMVEGNYMDFIKERQKNPDFKERKVNVEYSLSDEKAVYKITDEGSGFDYNKIFDMAGEEVNEKFLEHGRGLLLAKAAFDEIKFNDRGNQVLLAKHFKRK